MFLSIYKEQSERTPSPPATPGHLSTFMPPTERCWGGLAISQGCTCSSSLSPLISLSFSPFHLFLPFLVNWHLLRKHLTLNDLNHTWGHFGSNHGSNGKGCGPPCCGLAVPVVLLKGHLTQSWHPAMWDGHRAGDSDPLPIAVLQQGQQAAS